MTVTFSQRAVEAAAEAMKQRRRGEIERGRDYATFDELASLALTAALAVDGVVLQGWQPIESAPRNTLKVTSETFLLSHAEKKWVRFGKWYVQEGCWYYSGTNERSQYAQVRGDAPTHWMPLPPPPAASEGEERK